MRPATVSSSALVWIVATRAQRSKVVSTYRYNETKWCPPRLKADVRRKTSGSKLEIRKSISR